MNLKDIAHISGKPGLHRILKPTRSGVIIESLDTKKSRQVVGTQNRVSVLKEISIYTTTQESSEPLEKVMKLIFENFGTTIPIKSDDSAGEQSAFLEAILPEYDKTRVYQSDIKRLINWYEIISKNAPELFEEESEPASAEIPSEIIPEQVAVPEQVAIIEQAIENEITQELKTAEVKFDEISQKEATKGKELRK
jgi:hypothetical protein